MVRYSDKAIQGLVRLFKRFNDIYIFVEDTTYLNAYRIYFSRMLDGKARVRKIFPLGGREKVIEACVNGTYGQYKRRLFLIDGDLDLLLKNPPPKHKDIYRLPVYCMENLLISEYSVIEIAVDSSNSETRRQIRSAIKYGKWRRTVVTHLIPLFVQYAIARHYQIAIKTVGLSAHALCEGSGKSRFLSSVRVRTRTRQIRNEILKTQDRTDVLGIERRLRAQIPKAALEKASLISGKSYLLPLLCVHLRSNARYRDSEDALKVRLARYASLDADPALHARVIAVAGSA